MTDRRAYPSDLSDARRALIEHRLTAWRQTRTDAGVRGRTAEHDLREIFNAILYINRAGRGPRPAHKPGITNRMPDNVSEVDALFLDRDGTRVDSAAAFERTWRTTSQPVRSIKDQRPRIATSIS